MPGLALLRRPVFKLNQILGGGLLALFIMMPMDRGFPSISQGGKPLSPVIIFVGLGLLWLILQGGFPLFGYLRRRYVVLMGGFCVIHILTSFKAGLPFVVDALQFTATFLGGYVLFLHLAEKDGKGLKWLAPWVVTAGCIASVYGAVELFTGFQPGFYTTMFERANAVGVSEAGSDLIRGQGTQGNPILAAATVVMCLPFIRDLERRWIRIAACTLLILGVLVTVARTALFPMAVFAVGWIYIERRSAAKWLAPAAAGLVGGLATVMVVFAENPFVSLWLGRLGIGPGASAFASMNANTRQETVKLAIESMSTWSPPRFLIGMGANASKSVAERVSITLQTLDNTPFTLLYDRGIIALILFYAAPIGLLALFRRRAQDCLHWWAVPAQMAMGISFDYEAYSSFNLVVMASFAIATARSLAAAPSEDAN